MIEGRSLGEEKIRGLDHISWKKQCFALVYRVLIGTIEEYDDGVQS